MAVDTLFSNVVELIQGGSTTNAATPTTPRGRFFTGVTTGADHLVLGANGLVESVDQRSASWQSGPLTTTHELVVELNPSWSVGAQVAQGYMWQLVCGASGTLQLVVGYPGNTESYDVTTPTTGKIYISLRLVQDLTYNGVDLYFVLQPESGARQTVTRAFWASSAILSTTYIGSSLGRLPNIAVGTKSATQLVVAPNNEASASWAVATQGYAAAAQATPSSSSRDYQMFSQFQEFPANSDPADWVSMGVWATTGGVDGPLFVASVANTVGLTDSQADSIMRQAIAAQISGAYADAQNVGVPTSAWNPVTNQTDFFTTWYKRNRIVLPLAASDMVWNVRHMRRAPAGVTPNSYYSSSPTPVTSATLKTGLSETGVQGVYGFGAGAPATLRLTANKYTADPFTLTTHFGSLPMSDISVNGGLHQALIAAYSGTATVTALAQTANTTLFTVALANAGAVSLSTLTAVVYRQSVSAAPAVSKLYALRVTEADREAFATYPTLPWPTTSIPGGGGGSTGGDPNTLLLLHFNDTAVQEGSNTYLDSSGNNRVVTGTHSTTDVPPGTINNNSELAPSFGKHLFIDRTPGDPGGGLTIGTPISVTGPWTLEWRWYTPEGSSGINIYKDTNNVIQNIATSGSFFHGTGSGSEFVMGSSYSSDFSWRHLALVNDGTNLKLYSNGTEFLTAAGNYGLSLATITSGPSGSNAMSATMRMEEVRLSSVARYTGNFTAPTEPFPDGGGGVPTSALYYYPFEDGNTAPIANSGSISTHTLTAATNVGGGIVPSVSAAPGGGYAMRISDSAATINNGGSNSAFTPITGDFTMECWVYRDTLVGDYHAIFSMDGVYTGAWGDSGQLFVYSANTSIAGFSGTQMMPYQTWAHFAIVRTGGTLKGYLNGVLLENEFPTFGTATIGGTNAGPFIGGDGTFTNNSMPGYYDDFIVTVGAKYTANFTPAARGNAFPTTPSSDVQGAGYNDIDAIVGIGGGNQQATAPDAYGSGSVTLEDFAADQSVVIDNDSVNGTSNVTLAAATNSGTGLAATPTNASGSTTLDDFTSAASGVADVPVNGTGDATLEDATQLAVGLFLAPSEGFADILLDEFLSDGVGELQVSPAGYIDITMRMPTAYADGQPKSDNLLVTMGLPTVAARGRGVLLAEMPAAFTTATGTVPNIGRVAATMPMPTAQATGRVSGTGSAQVFMPSSYQLVGYGGGVLSATVEGYAAQATGISGTAGGITATLPMVVVVAAATRVNSGQIAAEMPMLVASPSGRLAAVMPMVRVVASGSAVVAITHEAYVLNMSKPMDDNPRNNFEAKNDQMTRYTNFPFTQVVRYLNSYYGVAADGLYLLEGTTDNGAPINWNVDLCMTDFGSSEKKNVASVYLGGQAGPTVDFTIQSGETLDQLHAHTTTAITAKRNHRQKFGLGRRTRYYSLGLSGQGDLAIDSIEFEVANTTRRI